MRNAFFAAMAALTLAAAPAGAQQADEPVPALSAGDLPSPGTAQLISLGATLGVVGVGWLVGTNDQDELGVGLAAAGLVLGPAAGYVYGGRTGRGLVGVGIRAGGATLMGVGASACEINVLGGPGEDSGCVLMLAGATVALTSMIYDMAVVDSRVREHNEGTTARVGVAPYVGARGGVGAVLTVRH